nr:acyltransferase family protein [Thermotoga sp. 38H-to]
MGQLESLRGLLILFVLTGHAIVGVYRDLTFLIPLLRFVSPSVFVFVYLFGYLQGRVKKNPLKVLRKTFSFFYFYLFWASVSFLTYVLLDEKCSTVWVTKRVFSVDDSILKKYLITIFSFTGSWQYYFVLVVMILLLISIFIKDPRKILPFSFAGAVANSSFVSFWFLTKDRLLPPIEGALITYLNPVHWLFPFLMGYKDAFEKKKREPRRFSLFLYTIFLVIGSLEYWKAYEKFHTLLGIDQFSLTGVLLGIYSIEVFTWLAEKANLSLLKRMGRYSFLLFMIHMPFQWMFYVFFDSFVDLPEWCWVIIMVMFSLMIMEILLKLARILPKPVRKVIIGA